MARRFVFRTDASLEIGTGHVMRCLTLAGALRKSGAECHFVCREHPGHLLDVIQQQGHCGHVLMLREDMVLDPADSLPSHAHWLGSDWRSDAEKTLAVVAALRPEWLIVDHYSLDCQWERTLRKASRRVMAIDDLADRRHDCDLLLDQNLGRNAADYSALVPERCLVLAGPHYALLRPEFAALRQHSLGRRAKPQCKRLLISMGGVDQPDATGQVLESLKTCPLDDDCRLTVLMGSHAPWLTQVRALAAHMPWPTEVLVNVGNVAQLMAASDLAIGAAGSTSWERCCLGLPTVMVVLAENQTAVAKALASTGCAKLLGGVDAITTSLCSSIREIMDAGAILAMSQASSLVTDGLGAERLSGYLEIPHG